MAHSIEHLPVDHQIEITECYLKNSDDQISHYSKNPSKLDDLKFKIEDIDMDYLNKTILDIINNLETIDKKIEDNSKTWRLNRIAKIDLSILRVALAEILYNELIPNATSINEAVKISKRYSADESYKFINGILGSVCRSL